MIRPVRRPTITPSPAVLHDEVEVQLFGSIPVRKGRRKTALPLSYGNNAISSFKGTHHIGGREFRFSQLFSIYLLILNLSKNAERWNSQPNAIGSSKKGYITLIGIGISTHFRRATQSGHLLF